MSSHCNKYPNCGCPSDIGIHCGKDDFQKAVDADWDKIEEEKRAIEKKYEGGRKRGKVRHKPTNLTPKKKKRKK